jgi:hypothetical protein
MRIIFVDYDGVFHPVSDLHWFSMGLPVATCIERGRLFRWTWILHEILVPHPDVCIVVHSSWRFLHPEERVKSLLGPLADRVVHVVAREYERADGVATYIADNGISEYIILDDHPEDFVPGTLGLVVCNSEMGVYDKDLRKQLSNWLNRTKKPQTSF